MIENKSYPLILGSITRNTVVSMTDIAMFNLFQDEKNIKKSLGGHGERAIDAVLKVSQGVKSKFGNKIKELSDKDWYSHFMENLPFSEQDMLICNLP